MVLRRLTRLSYCLAVVIATGCCSDEPSAPAAGAPGPADTAPMAQTGHRVEWGTPGVPCTMKAGSTVPVAVIVKNAGDQIWRDIPSSQEGRSAVRLGYRWLDSGGRNVAVDYTPVRGDLRAPLPPGKSATLAVDVVAPPTPGSYTLQLDLVEELVAWFEGRGAAKMLVPVTVN